MTAVSEIAEALQQGGLGEGPQRYRRLAEIIDETWKRSTVEHFDALREAVSVEDGRAGDELRELAGVQVLLAPYFIAAAFRAREERHASRLAKTLEDAGLLPRSAAPGVPTGGDVHRHVSRSQRRRHRPPGDQRGGASGGVSAHHRVVRREACRRAPATSSSPALERINLEVYSDFPLDIPPLLEMLAWCENERIEVIHAATPGPIGLAASVLARALDLPLIGTYHTDVPRLGYFLTGDHLLEEVLWNYMRWFYRSCEAVFTPSRGVERELAARGLAVRFEPLDQAVDAEAFSPERRDAGLHHELGGEGHVILWVGRVSAEKNLELLATAYAALREHRDDASLVIVGDGPYRKTLEAVAPEATFLGLPFRQGAGAHLRVVGCLRLPRRRGDLRPGRARGGHVWVADGRHGRAPSPARRSSPGRPRSRSARATWTASGTPSRPFSTTPSCARAWAPPHAPTPRAARGRKRSRTSRTSTRTCAGELA